MGLNFIEREVEKSVVKNFLKSNLHHLPLWAVAVTTFLQPSFQHYEGAHAGTAVAILLSVVTEFILSRKNGQ